MFQNLLVRAHRRLFVGVSVSTLAVATIASSSHAADPDKAVDKLKTASPIKHVLIIVGENRSFDHLFATYSPKTRGETISNLLSKHIVNADGTPVAKFSQAHQFQITSAPNNGKYFVGADLSHKSLHS